MTPTDVDLPPPYEEFFRRHGDNAIRLHFYEVGVSVTVEELYQLFKARMLAEVFPEPPPLVIPPPKG